jgi:hypothetical protein
MPEKKPKYLIETSAVRAATDSSTPAHNAHFREQVRGGTLWSSVYIRMEFIRRWVCDTIRVAITIDQCSSVSRALIILEQDFSGRSIKGYLACMASYLNQVGSMENVRRAAEEMGSLAVRWLMRFDEVFSSRINNLCKCKIGGDRLRVDYNTLLRDLQSFYESFRTPVTDCEVNTFLELGKPEGRSVSLLKDSAVSRSTVGENLANLAEKKRWVTCKECAKVGDLIIALEQPPSWCLVHLDGVFNALCRCRQRNHLAIKSILAIEKEQAQGSTPAS